MAGGSDLGATLTPDLSSWTLQTTNELTGSTLNITNVVAHGHRNKGRSSGNLEE